MDENIELNAFMRHNGICVEEFDSEHAVVTADVHDFLLNPYGLVHGGVYYTMMDIAAGVAARHNGSRYVTLDSSNHFYKSATGGRLIARSHVIHRGRTTCTLGTDVCDESGKLLADGTFTMFRLHD